MQNDDNEKQYGTEEEPHVDHLNVGRLGQRGGRLVEEGVKDEERSQAYSQTHLAKWTDFYSK